jgi:hypothetical protein
VSRSIEARARAIALAESAREAYLLRKEHWQPQIDEIDAWLSAR